MLKPKRTSVAMISPYPEGIRRFQEALAAHPEWSVDLVYGTCDPETMLLNLHQRQPACFILDLDMGEELVLVLVHALQGAGFEQFIFLGKPSGQSPLPGEAVPQGAPFSSIISAVYRLNLRSADEQPDRSKVERHRAPVSVAVHSPKGGVGKTLLACSLAVQYAAKGRRTLLMDMAMYGGVAPSLGIPRREKGLTKILEAVDQLPEMMDRPEMPEILQDNLWQFPAGEHRLDILTAGPPLKMAKLTVAQTEALLRWVGSGAYDIVVIDTSSEMAERTAVVMRMADHILLPLTHELSAAWAILSMQDLFKNLNITGKLQMVLNRSPKGLNVRPLEQALGHPISVQVPEVHDPWESAVGKNLATDYTAFGLALKRLAQRFYTIYSAKEIPALKGQGGRQWTSKHA